MRLVHDPDGARRVVAERVEVADTLPARARGLMFRRSFSGSRALAFPFERAAWRSLPLVPDGPGRRSLHMLFVPFPIDAVWVVDGRVERVKRLAAWTGRGGAPADVVYELPAGRADPLSVGDRLALVPSPE